MLILKYDIEIDIIECDPKVSECCDPTKPPPDDPGSGDCCYDTWRKECNDATARYNMADKVVSLLTTDVNYMTSQRDMWKGWYDELTKANDCSRKICHQLEIILHHTYRINKNTHLTLRAIHKLYCMVRDFYMQIDLLKKKYDSIINCIKCLNNPVLVPHQGIMILIEDYGNKLDIVIQTRDALLETVIKAISAINKINKNIGHHYGLHEILKEWRKAFNCSEKCYEDTENDKKLRGSGNKNEPYRNRPEGQIEDLGLKPHFEQPICNSGYYFDVRRRYEIDNSKVDRLNADLLKETKERDALKAWVDGLNAVLKDADPATRCATK
jgi:hypothetical protein